MGRPPRLQVLPSAIRKLVARGMTDREIGIRFGETESLIWHYRRRHNIPAFIGSAKGARTIAKISATKRSKRQYTRREVAAMTAAGWHATRIAKHIGVSVAQVFNLFKEYGLTHHYSCKDHLKKCSYARDQQRKELVARYGLSPHTSNLQLKLIISLMANGPQTRKAIAYSIGWKCSKFPGTNREDALTRLVRDGLAKRKHVARSGFGKATVGESIYRITAKGRRLLMNAPQGDRA